MTTTAGVEEFADVFERVVAAHLDRRALLERATTGAAVDVHGPIVAAGLPAILLDGPAGGLGGTAEHVVALFEIGGRYLLPVVERNEALVVVPILAAAAAAGDAGAAGVLEAILSGGARGGAGAAPAGAIGVPRRGQRPIELEETPVWLPAGAPVACVVSGDAIAIVDLRDGAFTVTPVDALDPGQGLVRLSGSAAVDERRIVAGPDALDVTARWHLGILAELTGVAGAMLDEAVAYACDRRQFGRPIAAFQAVSHRLAEMCAATEACRSMLARLVTVDRAAERDAILAAARHRLPQLVREVCEGAIQVHGGVGFTWELGLHLYYRRALQTQVALGGVGGTARDAGARYIERCRKGGAT